MEDTRQRFARGKPGVHLEDSGGHWRTPARDLHGASRKYTWRTLEDFGVHWAGFCTGQAGRMREGLWRTLENTRHGFIGQVGKSFGNTGDTRWIPDMWGNGFHGANLEDLGGLWRTQGRGFLGAS